MRFKGVVTKKGKNRGDVIEYSPEEKIRVGLGLALAQHESLQEYLVHPAKVEIKGLEVSEKGALLKKLWKNNSYAAWGRVEVSRRHKAKDRILRPETFEFSVQIDDCLCHNGLPELKVVNLELTPV